MTLSFHTKITAFLVHKNPNVCDYGEKQELPGRRPDMHQASEGHNCGQNCVTHMSGFHKRAFNYIQLTHLEGVSG